MANLFEVTTDHLKLIQHMYIDFREDYEFGAPGVDQKRPYGNSSVYHDMVEILEWDNDREDEDLERYIESIEMDLWQLHQETATVLQIMVHTLGISEGLYVQESPYGGKWVKASI